MSPWLTDEEIYVLTNKRQNAARRRALVKLRIPFRTRPDDGFPLVERVATASAEKPRREPRFEAVGAR